MSTRHQNRCASYLAPVKDGKVLLMKRQNTGFADGKYSLAAGHVEEGESFKQTMVREAREELGIEISEENLETFYVLHRDSVESAYVDFFFKVKEWDGEAENMEPEKCSELKWAEPGNLPKNTLDYVKEALKNRQNPKFYSEKGW